MNKPDIELGAYHYCCEDFSDLQAFTKRAYDIISIITILPYKVTGYECIYYAVDTVKGD